MTRTVHRNYEAGIDALIADFKFFASPVHTKHWQGIDISKKPEMKTYELLHPTLSVEMTGYDGDMEAVQEHVKANQPWASNHFQERVCGWPINPGIQWAKWPYGHSAKSFLDSSGRFNHNYMERYWPKYAGQGAFRQATETVPEHPFGGPETVLIEPRSGIKYEYGDLGDIVKLLANDPYTRQAYLPVWFPEDTGGGNKRAPCTLGYHFIMRNDRLDVTYYIRSCDLLRHFRDDVFLTHALVAWVWDECRKVNPDVWRNVELGVFTMHMTSLHVFANDWRTLFPGVNPPQ